MTVRPQRIRDPIHNLIEFGTDQFEQTLWQVIQTRPFQRLRRIRQLGFSDFVFPGATHSRFAHSLGVFHIARQLMRVIKRHIEYNHGVPGDHQSHVALAAALLHDVGHGMFSHAFEAVGKDKEFNLKMADHEHVSAAIIRDSEISDILTKPLGKSFADEVATLVGQKGPGSLYDAVVSSQFDADRLDYMQRDRLMTGVRSSGVDQTWLIANLEVHEVATGADDSTAGSVETLILGPKAAQTAESYLLSLFHLYPNVYLHKATRGAEVLFAALMRRLIRLDRQGHSDKANLPANHPIRRFIAEPDKLDHALNLDDSVFWGVLPMMAEADDDSIKRLAGDLHARRLLHCVDIQRLVEEAIPKGNGESHDKHRGRVAARVKDVEDSLKQWIMDRGNAPERVLLDRYSRPLYKRYQDSDTPLNRVLVRTGNNTLSDISESSPLIGAAGNFVTSRAYVFRDDADAEKLVLNKIRTSGRRRR